MSDDQARITSKMDELDRRGEVPHGLVRYESRGCRCEVCRAAHATMLRRWREIEAEDRQMMERVNGEGRRVAGVGWVSTDDERENR